MRGDLVEGDGEHVVQHERQPLGGSQRFEHHEQRQTDRVSQQRLVLGVGPVPAAHDRVGRLRAQRLLAAHLARAQHVQAHPRHDRRQPPLEVLDSARVGAVEPQPGFMDGVVRLAQRAEHPVGHRPQVGALGLESLRQHFPIVNGHSLRSHFVIIVDGRNPADVTEEVNPAMKETVHGTYKTTHWQEQEYSQIQRGPRLTVAETERTMEGGIQGKAILRYSVVHLSDGSNLFTGHVSMTGRVGDREGGFCAEDNGMGNADKASGMWKIVAGSASGDLVGLKGAASWK